MTSPQRRILKEAANRSYMRAPGPIKGGLSPEAAQAASQTTGQLDMEQEIDKMKAFIDKHFRNDPEALGEAMQALMRLQLKHDPRRN